MFESQEEQKRETVEEFDLSGVVVGVGMVTFGIILLIVLIVDDATIFGVADNTLVPAVLAFLFAGLSKITQSFQIDQSCIS